MLSRLSVIEPERKYQAHLLRVGSRLPAIVKWLEGFIDAQIVESSKRGLRMLILVVQETAAAAGAPRGFEWFSLGLVALIIGCLIGGLAGIRHHPTGNPSRHISQTPTLSLQAERRGADLRVSWTLGTEAFRHAEAGVLWIRDGDSSPREVHLDAIQLRTGHLVYTPLAEHVQFRLEVSDAHQLHISEWLLVLAAKRASAPEILAAGRNASSLSLALPQGPKPRFHEVQVGSFRFRANAERLCAEMKARYGRSRVALQTGDPPLWRVLVSRERIPADIEPIPATPPRPAAVQAKAPSLPVRMPETPGLPNRPGPKATTGGLVSDQVVQQVLPEVSPKARDTIQGTVRVRVKVRADASGRVVVATLDSPGPSRYFAEVALEAARGWKFSPAEFDGRVVSSDWILRFEFARTATTVFPVLATRADNR